MKKVSKLLLLSFLLPLSLACSNQDEMLDAKDNDLVDYYLTVVDTKTTLDGKAVNWTAGDELKAYFHGGACYKFTLYGEPAGATATFKAEVAAEDAEKSVEGVMYPYVEAVTNWSYQFSNVPIPANQTFVDGSFANGTNPSVGMASGTDVTFHNVAGIISVPVSASSSLAIKEVVLAGNNGETIAGSFKVNANDGSIMQTASSLSSITLAADAAVDVAGGKTFVFVLAPVQFTNGFSLTFVSEDDNSWTKKYDANVTLHTGKLATLNPIVLDPANFKAAFDPSSVNLAGTYNVMKKTSENDAALVSDDKYRSNNYTMGSVIELAETCAHSGEAGGRKYYLNKYNGYDGMYIFFDLSSTEVAPGCYKIVNFQDRAGSDPIPAEYNHSYYDSGTGYIHFDFVINGYWNHEGYCQLFYVAEDMESVDLSAAAYTSSALSASCITGDYSLNPGYGGISPEIWLAANLDTYNATYSSSAAASNRGQKYMVCYKNSYKDQILFFDLSGLKVDGMTDCYYLSNMQDRGGNGSDPVVDGLSYYDAVNHVIHFDFLVDGYWSDCVYAYELVQQ